MYERIILYIFAVLLFTALQSCERPDIYDALTPQQPESVYEETFSSLPSVSADSIPSPCSLWHNHLVALVEPITAASEALVTLLSLYEWNNLPSALNTDNPTIASTIAQGYQEYDITDWRIPTAAQAKALKVAYPAKTLVTNPVGEQVESTPSGINALILQAEGLPITPDARYLCEEATKSFSFSPGTTISKAGTKTTTYRLRLVCTLRMTQNK